MGKRSPHEATCRRIASRFYARTHHVFIQQHLHRKARSSDRHAANVLRWSTCAPDEDFDADPRFIPGAVRRASRNVSDWAAEFAGRSAVVICEKGHNLSEGVAAWLRKPDASAEVLEGGIAAWAQAGLPLVPEAKLPPRDPQGRTMWVTRERPKIDRIACPWLIRRFVDPAAVFLFVSPAEVRRSPSDSTARPSTSKGCSGATRRALHLRRDDRGIRARDANRCCGSRRSSAAPTPPASISRPKRRACSPPRSACRACTPTISNSSKPGMTLYDAFYRWARDATSETHNWPTNKKGA